MTTLSLTATFALATLVLWLGEQLQQRIPFCHRYNLPGPVLGGLAVSLLVLAGRQAGMNAPAFDLSAKTPLMIAFFTSIGLGASLTLLKRGGRLVLIFLGIAVAGAILQNAAGALLAVAMGEKPLLGVLAGSVTLTGGPATGLAFAPQFEQAGISGAEAIAVAVAMGGIILGGLVGTPVGTWLIRHLHARTPGLAEAAAGLLKNSAQQALDYRALTAEDLLKALGVIWLAMWLGGGISAGLQSLGLTLPAYIGAMLAAAIIRNLDDRLQWLRLSEPAVEALGGIALSYFLVLSLMSLELWKLAAVALPLLVMLLAQALLVAVMCVALVYPLTGRNYESAVMSGGYCGFMMGTTANAMANMDALTRRYGPAPQAFIAVPLVGAFFIDFANTLLVQACLSWLK
ncbi:ESS family glutamate:Na+ symporter [Fluviicoccus keumensis]|uniref:Sodium/glutamate symporter n=1 Tax=Fluviicoccus keumensis TaxID=1435465 RepID=A0A4Q7ZBM2_9GAMM|nr:sodium/glutamate symporter [Fluviicoccus keumensis]RZU47373.1 ESS family glutamate:Na+ symporter [Fluviicoccus keumensis]